MEDSAFFEHRGLSVRGLALAIKTNVVEGEVDQGGSTITQQLVKNGILDNAQSLDRKAKEAVLAVRMEEELPKDQILETYLNTVYFGQGAYGVEAAARRFFSKGVQEISLSEAALLAGMIASPEAYDPVRHPETAKSRRDHVLRRMVSIGLIRPDDAHSAGAEPLPTVIHRDPPQPNDHVTEEVRRRLLEDPRLGASPADPSLQAQAEQAVREVLPPSPFTAALVAIDPADGAVRALVGGTDFTASSYNLATQGSRQPGSSFKTIAEALRPSFRRVSFFLPTLCRSRIHPCRPGRIRPPHSRKPHPRHHPPRPPPRRRQPRRRQPPRSDRRGARTTDDLETVEISFDTGSSAFTDLTGDCRDFCAQRGGDGLLCVFVPHATAGVALFELGAGSEADLAETLGRLFPRDGRWRHRHGSPGHGADHVLPAFISPSMVIPVLGGAPALGTWQSIVLVDTNDDNPHRRVRLSLMRDTPSA